MTQLKCNVATCASNADNCCCRPDIMVEGPEACCCSETCCGSFQEKDKAVGNALRHDVPNQSLSVKCSAYNCVYNGAAVSYTHLGSFPSAPSRGISPDRRRKCPPSRDTPR